jgi:hypothetical protein
MWTLLSFCGIKISHSGFRNHYVRNINRMSSMTRAKSSSTKRPKNITTEIYHLSLRNDKWLIKVKS